MHLRGRNLATGRGTRRGIAVGAALVLVAGVVVATTRDSPCPAFAKTVGGRESPNGGEGTPRVNVVLTDSHLNVIRQLTDDDTSNEPAFSPSGRRLAYATGRGQPIDNDLGRTGARIHVMDLDGRHDRALTDGYDESPTWSPDGSALAFLRLNTPYEIWRVDIASGRQKKLAQNAHIQGSLQWLSDGRIIYVTNDGVMAVPENGGDPRLVVALSDRRTVFSPDGRSYAASPGAQGLPINVVEVGTGHVVQVPGSATAVAFPLLWTTDNHLLFTQNVRGLPINIASWHPGDKTAHVVGRYLPGLSLDLADNPACAP